jgi:hypothetical protein
MNAYFFPVSNEERENILNKHKHVYNGYKTLNPNPVENEQPLFVQDFANDKGGLVVNNKGEVKAYTNMGINEARKRKPYLDNEEMKEGEVDEFFKFNFSDEDVENYKIKKQKQQDERQNDLDSALSIFDKKEDELDESEHMCEQCGLKESLCECGGYMEEAECNECWNEGEVDEAEDGGLSTIEELGDAIMGSGRLEEILEENKPEDYSDEFEFVDNIISQLVDPYMDDEYYDELYEYIKDMYGETLFDEYRSEMGDEFDDDMFDDEEDEYVTEQSNNILSSETDSPIGRSSYSYISGGPEQFSDDEDEEHDGYEDDIENIQNMFDYASQHDADPDSKDMIRNLNKDMNQEFDGDEPSDDEKEAYTFISGGPPGVTFREEEEELDEEEVEEKWSEKYKNSIDCNNPKGFSQKAHCQGKKKESKEEVEKEVDEDLRESFVTQRNKITEMFQRFNKYN